MFRSTQTNTIIIRGQALLYRHVNFISRQILEENCHLTTVVSRTQNSQPDLRLAVQVQSNKHNFLCFEKF